MFPLVATVAALHLAGWGAIWLFAGPQHPTLLGLAGLAYVFGLRHAFDADHIAAIDNTTRRLMDDSSRPWPAEAQRRRPLGVGLFFSLGHSTVVFIMTLLIALAATAMTDQMPRLQEAGSFIGSTVSGVFLIAMGVLNLIVMVNTYRTFKRMRGQDEAEGRGLGARERIIVGGPVTRWFGGLFKRVTKPWHMYLVGFLFGLGFDTATEIGLLAMSGVAATQALPLAAVLALPIVFAAGMTLMDTADGVLMCGAYGWAFQNPLKKVFYNLTVTGLSVVVALFIGTIEIVSIVSGRELHVGLDTQTIGLAVVGLFAVSWLAAVVIWKVGEFEKA